jgi:hypothetical protein
MNLFTLSMIMGLPGVGFGIASMLSSGKTRKTLLKMQWTCIGVQFILLFAAMIQG